MTEEAQMGLLYLGWYSIYERPWTNAYGPRFAVERVKSLAKGRMDFKYLHVMDRQSLKSGVLTVTGISYIGLCILTL